MESFIAGFAYGGTTVLVGQPLDTIKTLQQVAATTTTTSASSSNKSMATLAKELYATGGGISAFYRGGLPLLVGGGLMRSAQFGVYNNALDAIRSMQGNGNNNNGKTKPESYLFGCIDPHVVLAGFCGGIGRGLVEGPFEMVKVRRQVQTPWTTQEMFQGSGTTLLRNSFLFASFAVYMDISKQLVVDPSPFLMGGICANLAWLTVWPLDVVKSRMQSGTLKETRFFQVLVDASRAGHLYRGLGPGLVRSFLANGSSMVVYKFVEQELQQQQS